MADARHTFEALASHLIRSSLPLVRAAASLDGFRSFAARLGFQPTSIPAPFASLSVNASGANLKVDGFSASASITEILDLVSDAKSIFDSIQNLRASPPAGVDASAWASEIGPGIFARIFTDYLSQNLPVAFSLLSIFGVIEFESVFETPGRPGFVRPKVDWSVLSKFFSDPTGWPARTYGWGTPQFDAKAVIEDLLKFFYGFDFTVSLAEADEDLLSGYAGVPTSAGPRSLRVPFFGTYFKGKPLVAAFELHALPAQGASLPGIVLEPQLPTDFPLELPLHPNVTLRLVAGTNAGTRFGIVLRPKEISIKAPFAGDTPPVTAGIGFDLKVPEPVMLLGSPRGTRLEWQGTSIDLNASQVNGQTAVVLSAGMKDMALVISGQGEGLFDGFLEKILGSGASRVTIPLGIEWGGAHGIRFQGSGGFDVQVHPHLTLGPIRFDDLDIRLHKPDDAPSDLRLDLAATVAGSLGPLDFFVRGIGMRVDATFHDGNLGPLDLQLGFLPPYGVGSALDVGGFKGGGFLILDTARGEYDGGLELDFKGIVTVKAVGLLNTRFPDGHSGYSLLILISAEFPPIQLGLGFTLLGVGGLIGVSRTLDEDALREGVHQGALDSVLFPRDVVANAPRIVADLQRLFPPLEDHFLVGPMVKFGWGTPTILSLEFGIILDIPRPAFMILGRLRIGLPFQDLPLFDVRVAFAGGVDFEKGQFWLDGTLYDSRLLTFGLTGDMAVRLYWGDNANFILTVGGFHPAYTPPPMALGNLQRLAITIFDGNPRLRAETYFAITSNTVQFGAKAELYFGLDVFNVYGFIALDVLIQFDPFRFIATLTAMLAVRTGGETLLAIRVDALLEGPKPWHARGTGHFEISIIITISLDADFEITLGDTQHETVLPVAVLPKLVEAFDDSRNWRAVLPAGTRLRVTPPSGDDEVASNEIVLHPSGSLEISQKLIPLDFPIQKVGTQRISDGKVFSVDSVSLGTGAGTLESIPDQFAPAQFTDMDDAKKLSSHPFQTFDAGVRVGGYDDIAADYFTRMELAYEVVYVPEHRRPSVFKLIALLFGSFVRAGAISKSMLSAAQNAPSPLGTGKIRYSPEQFAITSTSDLTLHDDTSVFATEAHAEAAMAEIVQRDPAMRHEIQIVPFSLARAA